MKRARKVVSIMVTLAMLIGLLLPAMPAAAVTDNKVTKVITVKNDFEGFLSTLSIKEDSNNVTGSVYAQDFKAGDSFVITLPDGVKFATYDSANGWQEVQEGWGIKDNDTNVYKTDFSGTVSGKTVEDQNGNSMITGNIPVEATFSNERTLNVTFTGNGNGESVFALNLFVIVDGASGDLNVDIDGLDSGVSSGEVLVARIVDGGSSDNKVLNVESIGDSNNQKVGTVRITEATAGNFEKGDEVTLTLNNGFKFNEETLNHITLMGGFAGYKYTKNSATSDNNQILASKTADDEITIKFGPGSTTWTKTSTRGIIEITPYVDVESDADYGDVTIDIDGDNVASQTVTVAKYGAYGATVTAKSVEEVIAGEKEVELGKLVIEETAAGSLVNGRKITIELPDFAKFAEGYDTLNTTLKEGDDVLSGNDFKVDPSDRHKAELTISRSSSAPKKAAKIEVELKKVNTSVANPGDINVKVTSSSGIEEQEVLVGKSIAPVTATVENVKDLKLGVQGQVAGDIIIKENKKGALKEGVLELNVPADGVKFAKTPTVEVTEGNIELGTVNKGTAKDGHTDDLIKINIDNDSTQPSTIKVSNVVFDIDRTVAVGGVQVKIKGTAVTETHNGVGADEDAYFDASTAASVYPGVVVNAAPEAGSASFNIGATVYTVNGVAKVMDAAPYIKDGRTYVPVRYLAYAIGVTDDNIQYDATTGTVTLTKGDKVVKLVIGDKNLSVGETVTAMDVAPEINNGRTMLPARFVAEAFGAQVGYGNGTVVISY